MLILLKYTVLLFIFQFFYMFKKLKYEYFDYYNYYDIMMDDFEHIRNHISKLQLEKRSDRKLLKYLDEIIYLDFAIDLFPRHILIAKLWQKDQQDNYDVIKILLKSNVIQDYLQNKLKNIKKLSIVGILSGNQNFDEKVNYNEVFITTIITSNLKQFKLLLTLGNIDPSINNNFALCDAIITQDIASTNKLKKNSAEIIKLLLNDLRVVSESSIITFITKERYNMNYILKNSISVQNTCSKLLVENAKEDINIIIEKCVLVLLKEHYCKITSNPNSIEKLLFIVCNNPNINLEQFVNYIIKNPNFDIEVAIYYILKYNDPKLMDILLTNFKIENIHTWINIIKHVITFNNIKLLDFVLKYPFFSLYDITIKLFKNSSKKIMKNWFDETKIDFSMILQNNINTKNLEHIELLLSYYEYDGLLDIKNVICSINNNDLLSSIFSIGIKNKYLVSMELMLDNIFFDPFSHQLYHNYHFINLMNVKKIKFKKLVEYYWTKIILILDIFLIKDIRQIIFNMSIMTNHIIFTIL